MSVKIMGLVWDLNLSRDEKFVLLAYADHADHDGGSIFPSIETISKKTGYSERSVQRITRKLENSGYLMPAGGQKGGVGITAKWYIPMKGDKITPFHKGDKNDAERVTNDASKGDIAVSPDPSLTVKESSLTDGDIFSIYENEVGQISPMITEQIGDWIDGYSLNWIKDAIKIAVENNVRKPKYINTILENWKIEGRGNNRQKEQVFTEWS